MPATPVLDIRELHVSFDAGHDRRIHAVDGVSLTVNRGETLGVVGESGSGKSTLGNAILGLVHPTSGQILFDGTDITHATRAQRRGLSSKLQVVFQDPIGSLNPSRTIGQTLTEPLRIRDRVSKDDSAARAAEVLTRVGLSADAGDRYPAQFSGGQRQRIAIARALIQQPTLIICDEPTSALDLSVQAQILNLLLELQEELDLAYLFISHDIDVVRHVSHRVAVMLAGTVVEQGPTADVTDSPSDPYTKALLAAAPIADPTAQATRRRQRAQHQPATPPAPAHDSHVQRTAATRSRAAARTVM